MKIYPAVDIKNGRAVRLLQGRAADITDYGEPVLAAKRWSKAGAKRLHIVDLDGAFTGDSVNIGIITEIVRSTGLDIQLGGGIRTLEQIEDRLSRGIWRVVIGTAAIEDPEILSLAAKEFAGRVVCGIDAKNGRVSVRGWVDESEVTPVDLALKMKDCGIKTIVYTDISKDGTLEGPNFLETEEMIRQTGLEIIASGGVGGIADVLRLQEIGSSGVIIGKALYNGNIEPKQALALEV